MKQYQQYILLNNFDFRSPISLNILCSDDAFNFKKERYYEYIS